MALSLPIDVVSDRRPILNIGLFVLVFAFLSAGLFRNLVKGIWQTVDGGYSPVIMLLALGMATSIWTKSPKADMAAQPHLNGLICLVFALLLFLAGRILGNDFIAYWALVFAICGTVVYVHGWARLSEYRLPLLALIFATPLPGSLVTSVTFPLKMQISKAAVAILSLLDFPVSRSGVLIDIGNYRLLVAEACSGLQSMFSLMAVAVFFVFVMNRHSIQQTIALMLATVPIIFLLNIVRVVFLALITYWFGDEAGQGFLHAFAGMAMFILAFFALMGLDKLICRMVK